jgi:hypothetical protein
MSLDSSSNISCIYVKIASNPNDHGPSPDDNPINDNEEKYDNIFKIESYMSSMSSYIKNIFNSDLDDGLTRETPIIIPSTFINNRTLAFIVKYMQLYKTTLEVNAPAKPLASKLLECIFHGNECELFNEIYCYNIDNNISVCVDTINEYVSAANYLGMDKLVHKLCAIIASYIKGYSIEDLDGAASIL